MRVGCTAIFSLASRSPRNLLPAALGDASLANLQPEAGPSAPALVDMQSAHTLAGIADELTATGIKFHAVEPRSSVPTGSATSKSMQNLAV